jgi:hypothetical protein
VRSEPSGNDPKPAGGAPLRGLEHDADYQPDQGLDRDRPLDLREQLSSLSGGTLIGTLAALRPGPVTTPTAATKMTMRALA